MTTKEEQEQEDIRFIPAELRFSLYTKDASGIYREIPHMMERFRRICDRQDLELKQQNEKTEHHPQATD